MKKIIINERGEAALFKHLLNEEVTYLGDKEDVVTKWLNNHFKAMENETLDNMGLPQNNKVVSILNSQKQITTNIITLEKAFYILQAQFKNILHDKKERDTFLWNTLNKWYQ
jgi:hypothetical protein